MGRELSATQAVARWLTRAVSAATSAGVRGGGEVEEGANLEMDGLFSDVWDNKKY